MGKLRFLLALWLAKLSVPALKLTRHNGSNFPGTVAIRLCPDFLRYVGRPKTVIAVTGTNGKTTVSNMLSDALEADGLRVMSNRAGSNMIYGICTAYIMNSNLLGKAGGKCDVAVLEVDERSSLKVHPLLKPDYLLVTNLCRDSTMRHAHPDFMKGIISRSLPKETKLVLNADDMISCDIAPENPRVTYGIDRMPGDTVECVNLLNDRPVCPRCCGKLEYVYRRYHHFGKAVCRDCGFSSPESTYLARQVDTAKRTMVLTEAGEDHPYHLVSDSVFNIYNMVAVVAMLRQLGFSHEKIRGYMDKAAVLSTRYQECDIGDFHVVSHLSKGLNAFATSRTFQYLADRPGRKELFLMINDLSCEAEWSENVCWLYDTDFELLARDEVTQVICTGKRGIDYKLRLLLAGVPEDRVFYEENDLKALELLHFTPGDDIYLLHDVEDYQTERLMNRLTELANEHSGKEGAHHEN